MSGYNEVLTFDAGKEFFDERAVGILPPLKYKIEFDSTWFSGMDDADPSDVLFGVTLSATEGDTLLHPTISTLLSFASSFSISRDLLQETPSSLIQPVFNYWLSLIEDGKGPQFAVTHDGDSGVGNALSLDGNSGVGNAISLAKSYSLLPVTMSDSLEMVLKTLIEQGAVSSESEVSIVPLVANPSQHKAAVVFGSEVEGWRSIIEVSISPDGHMPLMLTLGGQRTESGVFVLSDRLSYKHSPKKHGKAIEMVSEWLETTTAVLAVEAADVISELIALKGVSLDDDLDALVNDIFSAVRFPLSLRSLASDAIVHLGIGEASAFNVMVCIADVQHVPNVDEPLRDRVRRAAGLVPSVIGTRCEACHSLLASGTAHSH